MFTVNAIILSVVAITIFFSCMFEIGSINISLFYPSNQDMNIRIKYLLTISFFLLFGICVKDTYDIGFYREAYVRRVSHGKEPLFDVIQFFFHDAGYDFDTFKSIWIIAVSILLYKGIKEYSKKPEQVVALTFVGVLTSFITQMRSALALAIILNIIPLLFSEKKRDKMLYGLLVIMCAQLHIVAYVFLLFLVVKSNGRRNCKRKYFVALGLLTIVTIGMNAYFVNFLIFILGYFPVLSSMTLRMVSAVSGVNTPIKASIFLVFEHFFLYMQTDRACWIQMEEQPKEVRKYEVISQINTLSLVFIPICILNESFTRLFNPIMLLQYAMILNVGHKNGGISKSLLFNVNMKTIIICFTVFVFGVSLHSNPDDFLRMMRSLQF